MSVKARGIGRSMVRWWVGRGRASGRVGRERERGMGSEMDGKRVLRWIESLNGRGCGKWKGW